jgi:hypothetical protein
LVAYERLDDLEETRANYLKNLERCCENLKTTFTSVESLTGIKQKDFVEKFSKAISTIVHRFLPESEERLLHFQRYFLFIQNTNPNPITHPIIRNIVHHIKLTIFRNNEKNLSYSKLLDQITNNPKLDEEIKSMLVDQMIKISQERPYIRDADPVDCASEFGDGDEDGDLQSEFESQERIDENITENA